MSGYHLIALFPYFIFFALKGFLSTVSRGAASLIEDGQFIAIWIFSLLSFVVMRSNFLARIYKSYVYDALEPGFERYFLIFSNILVYWLCHRHWRQTHQESLFIAPVAFGAHVVSFAIGLLIFYFSLFAFPVETGRRIAPKTIRAVELTR